MFLKKIWKILFIKALDDRLIRLDAYPAFLYNLFVSMKFMYF